MGLLGDIADFGKGVIENNLRWTERAANFFASQIGPRLIRAARSPIMTAGQQTIESMKRSTGVGDPESGQSFGDGADTMGAVGEVLASAFPDDSWNSGGAAAYADRNTEQVGRVQTMLGLDNMVAEVLSAEARQIAAARDSLDGHSDWLGAMSLLTTGTGIIPGFGTAAQMSAEVAMVAKAVSDSSGDLKTLSGHIDQNAAVVRTAAAQYETLVGGADPNGAEFAPPVGDPDAPAAPGDPEADVPGGTTSDGDAPSGGGPSGGAPSGGGGGGAPTGSSVPVAAPSMPAAMPASASSPSSAAASEAAGALGGILGSLVSPLGAILGGVLQAAGQAATQAAQAGTQAAQMGSQAAGQLGGTGSGADQLDKASDGTDADGPAGGDHEDREGRDGRDDKDHRDDADDRDGDGEDDGPGEGRAGGPPGTDSAGEPPDPPGAGGDDEAARTLPPDLEAVAAGSGVAGPAPVHVGADFEQGQLHMAAAATLDRGVPGSAAVIDR
ncbi:EspA/EspE family type VII secretion system effector [Mycolicibacterium sp. 050232]|uniref:EspA/EspE family type VII secretion system effector n=1 Tax=Mycolicibacterium sp. 050232 TaxID=3113982 RepID=UPI002E2C5838|nr:EspA/EspE family type VII secretion system effector [Mycolicibacterium sp. 050232]MED5815696.1 EspA/EspE family type VII secretion system effector [Mycolicibacterium sp. 050232]